MCRKIAEKCRKVPNIAQYWAQFGNTLIKFGVCYLLIQLAILWQSRNPGAHAKLFGCPIKGCSPELFPKNAEKCRIVPNVAEKCRIVPNIGQYCRKVAEIFGHIWAHLGTIRHNHDFGTIRHNWATLGTIRQHWAQFGINDEGPCLRLWLQLCHEGCWGSSVDSS